MHNILWNLSEKKKKKLGRYLYDWHREQAYLQFIISWKYQNVFFSVNG